MEQVLSMSSYKISTKSLSKKKLTDDKTETSKEKDENLCLHDWDLFGDRAPEGYKKTRLFSKLRHQVYWLFQKSCDSSCHSDTDYQDMHSFSDGDEHYFIIQQIPRKLPCFNKYMDCIASLKSEFSQRICHRNGMRKHIFEIDEVLDEPDNEDVWVIFQTEDHLNHYISLHDALWKIENQSKSSIKTYLVQHQIFFNLLMQDSGKS